MPSVKVRRVLSMRDYKNVRKTSRRCRRATVPLGRTGNLVAAGRKAVQGASVGNIMFSNIRIGVAGVRDEIGRLGERSQLVRVSEVDNVCSRLPLRPALRVNVPR